MSNMKTAIQIDPRDNVAVACEEIDPHDTTRAGTKTIELKERVRMAHKFALRTINRGEKVIKYGVSIGTATQTIHQGEHVHLHNMKSDYIPTPQKYKEP